MIAAELFWARVRKTDGCWEWTRARHRQGYGNISIDGRSLLAHRVSWELAHGPIPDGICVCHRCDNPRCVRPDHLFLGTHVENMRDMANKCRSPGTRAVEHAGRRLGIKSWSKITGIPRSTIARRLALGWDAARALGTPSDRRMGRAAKLGAEREQQALELRLAGAGDCQIAKAIGVSPRTIRRYLGPR